MSARNKEKVYIATNGLGPSKKLEKELVSVLDREGFDIAREYSGSCGLIICIGGDGTFLNLIHDLDFPKVPIVGINTGHLGFFQEIDSKQTEEFIRNYKLGNYKTQKMSTVEIELATKDGKIKETGLNEVVIRGKIGCNIHLDMSIDGRFMERFTGDGILVATPAGSTAYNYSLGGSIVDPRIDLLQITPIAPINTNAYRSFTSSLLLPAKGTLELTPVKEDKGFVHIEFDGLSKDYENVDEMHVKLSNKKITLIRLDTYDFWNKVKSKFL